MNKTKLALAVLLVMTPINSIAGILELGAAKILKSNIALVCEDDGECRQAVNEQFDSCLGKSGFWKFVGASPAEEDEFLDSTLSYLYSCIVDQDGEPYFPGVGQTIKSDFITACEDDESCKRAVGDQFDSCLKNSDLEKYMDASPAEEDRFLNSTFSYLYSCIVDQDGNPYFEPAEE